MPTPTLTTDEARVIELCDELLAKLDPKTTPPAEFLGAQYDLGLAWVHFPEGEGGLALSPKLQTTITMKLLKAGGPLPYGRNPIGYGMCAPTVVMHGTQQQKARYLRPLFTGEEIWCQMFSEPGAGSDVAGLATRAIRDGEEWILNGQKVWTTLAHVSRFGIVLARTDPDKVKHKGMTMFVMDMEAPGVEVRPLVQATGEAEFNEVYMTDVRIADSERLGDVGEGWHVSLTTLMNERVSIGGQVSPRGSGVIQTALNAYERSNRRGEAVARDQLAQFWIEAEVNRLTNMRASQLRAKGTPGPEGSVGKMAMAGLNQRLMAFVMELLGPEAMLYPGGYPMDRPTTAMDLSKPQKAFLRVQANSIEGGTTNIMKNILSERVLGLPGEPRADKDVPWSEVPRS
ncbi:MAG: acyl-CoA dehydrogenase family protein [Acidimicrobiia bacterium]